MLDIALQMDAARAVPATVFAITEIAPQTSTAAITLFAGTTVLTLRGEVAVETLIPGERIITRDAGMVLLYDLDMSRAALPAICVGAGAFGQARPQCDTLLAADARINVRADTLDVPASIPSGQIAAVDLTNGKTVTSLAAADRVKCTLIFDRPHVIYADGLELCAF